MQDKKIKNISIFIERLGVSEIKNIDMNLLQIRTLSLYYD